MQHARMKNLKKLFTLVSYLIKYASFLETNWDRDSTTWKF